MYMTSLRQQLEHFMSAKTDELNSFTCAYLLRTNTSLNHCFAVARQIVKDIVRMSTVEEMEEFIHYCRGFTSQEMELIENFWPEKFAWLRDQHLHEFYDEWCEPQPGDLYYVDEAFLASLFSGDPYDPDQDVPYDPEEPSQDDELQEPNQDEANAEDVDDQIIRIVFYDERADHAYVQGYPCSVLESIYEIVHGREYRAQRRARVAAKRNRKPLSMVAQLNAARGPTGAIRGNKRLIPKTIQL